MSVDAAAKEIKSVLIDYPFDVPTFATVQLKDRWERLLTKVDVRENSIIKLYWRIILKNLSLMKKKICS